MRLLCALACVAHDKASGGGSECPDGSTACDTAASLSDDSVSTTVDTGWVEVSVGGASVALTHSAGRAVFVPFMPSDEIGEFPISYYGVTPVGERYVDATAGGLGPCALTESGAAVCFGETQPPDAPFARLERGSYLTCGQRADLTWACWGYNYCHEASEHVFDWLEPLTDISFSDNPIKGLSGDGTILACGESAPYWGDYGTFVSIAGAGSNMCGLSVDGSVFCGQVRWDDEIGPYSSISVGDTNGCGIRAEDGSVDCYSSTAPSSVDFPNEPGPYRRISTYNGAVCGITTTGAVHCWGKDLDLTPDFASAEAKLADLSE